MRAIIEKYRFLLFPLLTILWFAPAYRYGIASDFIGWIYKYNAGDFSDIIHCFGYNGLHQVFHFINYSFYSLVGTNHFAWYLCFAILHGLNTVILFSLVKRLKTHWAFSANGLEWFVALCFLFSPYQVEVVTWKACMHYLLSAMSVLSIFYLLISYLELPKRKTLYIILGLFFASLFVLEINLSVPFMLAAFLISDKILKPEQDLISNLLKVCGPMILMVCFYFLLNKLYLGDWVGHYGTEEHLKPDPTVWLGHAWAYLAKYLGLSHYLHYGLRDSIYSAVMNPYMIFGLLGISLSIVIWLVEHRESTDRRLIVSAMSFVLFFMALIPILSLYFYYITPYANDRYSYVASPFFFLGFILLLYRLSANWRYSVLILYLILNMFHSRNMIKSAVLAGQGLDYSLQNLPCDKLNDKDVFLLGLADNFQGNYYYRSFSDDGDTFVKSMKLFYPERSCEARSWHNPAQYNLNYATEGLKAHFVDAQTIKVFIAQNGTWFMRNGIGLANYENDIYSVELHGWYYLLKLKENFDNAIFLVPSGAEWSELKRPVAEEIN